jgi:DNA-binding NarL/FixJ family response regulator
MVLATERISLLVSAASRKADGGELQRPILPLAKPIRILIAAQDALMRRSLRVILEQQSGWVVIAEAAAGEEAIVQAEGIAPDVAVINVDIPVAERNVASMMRAAPRMRVLVLGIRFSEVLTCSSRRYRWTGLHIQMRSRIADCASRRKAPARGEEPCLPGHVFRRLYRGPVALTRCETEVLRLVATGCSVQETAVNLGLRESTIRGRLCIMNKLVLSNFNELVRYAVRHSIINP